MGWYVQNKIDQPGVHSALFWIFFNTQLQITQLATCDETEKEQNVTSTLSKIDSLVVYVILLIWENFQIELGYYIWRFDRFGYSPPVKKASNETTGTLNQGLPIFSFYTLLMMKQ